MTDDIDADDLDPETLSLCLNCAKHPALKRFVREHRVEDVRCGICLAVDPPACDLGQRKELNYLIRSLMRFEYDESAFNTHFGADHGPEALLQVPNSIVEHAGHLFKDRSPERSEPFLVDLFANDVYPDEAEGVSLFAGHSEETRLFHHALKHGDRSALEHFKYRLERENYFDVEPDLVQMIDKVADRITVTAPQGQIYFRARIGIEGRFEDMSELFNPQTRYKPYQGAALGAPPPLVAGAGRLNRAGVAFLYLASDLDTACCEIRPHPGHMLSIGQYMSLRPLRLANLETDIGAFATSDDELDLFAFVFAADMAMSLPVLPGEAVRYSITQLIAEVLRQRGFDGVAFKSSVSAGRNVCLFKPGTCVFIEGSAVVRRVTGLTYALEEAPSLQQEGADDIRVN